MSRSIPIKSRLFSQYRRNHVGFCSLSCPFHDAVPFHPCARASGCCCASFILRQSSIDNCTALPEWHSGTDFIVFIGRNGWFLRFFVVFVDRSLFTYLFFINNVTLEICGHSPPYRGFWYRVCIMNSHCNDRVCLNL